MQVPKRWERRARTLEQKVLGVEDEDLRLAVAFLLEALADAEDPCAIAVFMSGDGGKFALKGFHIDQELGQAVISRVGEDALAQAVHWLREELRGSDLAWMAWLFHRIELEGRPAARFIEGREGIVWDLQEKTVARRRR